MSYNTLLEKELERRATNRDKDSVMLWRKYNDVNDYLSNNYYKWVHDELPYYTDHGERHVQSVVQAASLLLHGLLEDRKRRTELTSLDIFALLSAILWHDVGMVLGRAGHEKRIGEVSEEIKKTAFPNPAIQRLIIEIAGAHGGKDGLSGPKSETYCQLEKHYHVYPKALAGLLRFADEISEDQSRISTALLPRVPEKSRVFWEYANCIVSSIPEPEKERVVVTIALEAKKATAKLGYCDFPQHCDKGGEIPLITYVLCRLEKMNNERIYCSRVFNRYVTISEIEARFEIVSGAGRFKDYSLDVVLTDGGLRGNGYPTLKVVDEFFKSHPTWEPKSLSKDLRL